MNKLHVFLVCTFMLSAALADNYDGSDFEEYFKKIITDASVECVDQLHVSVDLLDFKNDNNSNETLACLYECIHKKTGLIKNGTIDLKRMEEIQLLATGRNLIEPILQAYGVCFDQVQKHGNKKCGLGMAIVSCTGEWSMFDGRFRNRLYSFD